MPFSFVRLNKLELANFLKHFIWIECIAQPITNVIDGDDARKDHQAGEDSQPRIFDGTLLIVSGVMISEIALPALGIKLPMGFAWRRLHDLSANFALVLLGVHTAFHQAKKGCIHMKTIGRILIILVVFSIVAGLMVTAVKAGRMPPILMASLSFAWWRGG